MRVYRTAKMERVALWPERFLTLGVIKLIYQEKTMCQRSSHGRRLGSAEASVHLCVSEPKSQILHIYKLQSSW